MLIIIKIKITDTYLPVPDIIQKRLGIKEYSKINLIAEPERIRIEVCNPEEIQIKRPNPYYSDETTLKTYTIVRNDFVCQNPSCNKPILKKRGKKICCSRKCLAEYKKIYP